MMQALLRISAFACGLMLWLNVSRSIPYYRALGKDLFMGHVGSAILGVTVITSIAASFTISGASIKSETARGNTDNTPAYRMAPL